MENDVILDESFRNLNNPGQEKNNITYETCSFTSCNLSNGLFNSCRFIDCVFTACNLAMSTLSNSQLNNVTFRDCKLLGLNFINSKDSVFVVRFENCVLDYSSFTGKKMMKTSFINSSVRNTDFTESDLTKSVFQQCDLLNSTFYNTILKEVDFLTAVNYIIDPELNKIKKSRFALNGVPGLLTKYDIIIE